jgi:hypothetical protein
MNQTAFAAILDRSPKDVEKPKTLPIGTYAWLIRGQYRLDKSTQKKTEFVEFTVVPQGPVQGDNGNLDVDQEQLDEALTRRDGTKTAIQSKSQRLTFYLTEDALFRLEDFLRHLGFEIPTEAEKKNMSEEELEALPSFRSMLGETPNRQFAGYISHKPSEDGTQMYANITKTMPLD